MSGERKGDREVMDELVKTQVDSGISLKQAKEKAREVMAEVDRRQREQGKR